MPQSATPRTRDLRSGNAQPRHEAVGWRLCVAPMMDWTDRHCRFFHRLLSPHARLYSEMLTAAALVHGDREHLLRHHDEYGVALQLGGSDPQQLVSAAQYGAAAGYAEINLNVGCPSSRVQSGRFGACLMREPQLVARCVRAMQAAVDVPVTVKCRIGVDNQDSWADLQHFADTMCAAGVQVLEVHARKAWLQGLSPKENRDKPPLDPARVYRLKESFPELTVIINGGVGSVAEIEQHLEAVDGVMLGRAAYRNPWLLAQAEHALWGTPMPTRATVLRSVAEYIEGEHTHGTPVKNVLRHVLGLYQGQPRGKRFRRVLSEGMHRPDADVALLEQALMAVEAVPAAA